MMAERREVSFAELLEGVQAIESARPFQPFAWYRPDNDTLEVFLSDAEFIREQVDEWLSAFVDPGDRSHMVGLAIRNFARNFGAMGTDGLTRVRLDLSVTAGDGALFVAIESARGTAEWKIGRSASQIGRPGRDRIARLERALQQLGKLDLPVETLSAA